MAGVCTSEECRHRCCQIFSIDNVKKKFPITKWLPKYRLEHFQGDAIAGLTVGLTVIPQGLALAHVAGLPPQYGLYTSFVGCFVYMFLGTSKDITVGPTAIMSLLVSEFGRSPIPNDATYAIILTMFGGIVQLLMGLLRIGFVIDYISHPVINSFTTAAAITIAEGQLKNWFGLHKIPQDFIHELYWTLRKIPETNLWDFGMGTICIILLVYLKLLRTCRPNNDADTSNRCRKALSYSLWLLSTARNALVVLLAALTVLLCQNCYGIQPFTTTANVTAGLPRPQFPRFEIFYNNHTYTTAEIFSNIGPGFVVIPILGLVETMAIGKAFAKRNRYTLDPNQEFIAVGASNIVGSFFWSYPMTGSFSRTAVNSASGVRTPAGSIFTGLLVIISLIFLTPYFHLIPNAALAAVIITAVSDMVDFSLIMKLWRVKRVDLVPWIVTFLFCLLLGVEWGILIGIGLSLLMLLYLWGRPKITDQTDNYLQLRDLDDVDDVVVLSLNQGLTFPGVDFLKESIISKAFTENAINFAVIDCCHVVNIDYTVVEGIGHLLDDFNDRERAIVFCCLQPDVLATIEKADLKSFYHCPTVEDGIRFINSIQKERQTLNVQDDDFETQSSQDLLSSELSPTVI